MKHSIKLTAALLLASLGSATALAEDSVHVSVDNFARAESDMYFTRMVNKGGFGKLNHNRALAPIDQQTVVRLNRDTLYSSGVFDLDAGPVTVTLPDAGTRFMSMQVISEEHYVPNVFYGAGTHTLTRDGVGTRYAVVGIRTLVDPNDPNDVQQVSALQDQVQVQQANSGKFEVPKWDPESQKRVREALIALNATLPNLKGAFGSKDQVEPVRHLIGAAAAWGGNPDKDATYLNVTPAANDGKTVYRLTVRDVPVKGFWSISVYNAKGYFEANPYNAYTLNSITSKKSADGSVTVQFGGCDGKVVNCLPVMPGWNYMVRLYRPGPEVLDGSWSFPEARPLN
ncbi:hypothetical protein Pres01_03640 [Metapseudomonas resinovorans]|uniref:DUF1254 domain-containing protein n=1 Tax=Metapseudomonas resinovorans TaxID=53412 RepID=UPI000986731D|nr:DUF1254 domain-containing protein [Pseudomonas resinovorans]GLZ84313.1 hypothetical protein Pres01_03640 [Pseudomonas resinovorans]